MKDELKEFGLKVRYSDNPDAKPIDFEIYDEEDNVAWCWGSNPDDVEVECNHPTVEFMEDEPTGYCPICGATCDCHYEIDEGNVEDYYWSGRRLVPDHWVQTKEVGGIIGKYLKELREKYDAKTI